MTTILAFAVERRRAAAADREAARRYQRLALAAETYEQSLELTQRASESLASAEANETAISRRLRGGR